MEKRLSMSDYVLVLVFIFMFFCIIGAFFFGLQMGKDKTEQKYELMLEEKQDSGAAAASSLNAYDQQQFISFYHMVYEPYREFQNKWFDELEQLDQNSKAEDITAALKSVKGESQNTYAKLKQLTASPSSPLLISSQELYMKSLQQFTSAMDELMKLKWEGKAPADTIHANQALMEAQRSALNAEASFYEAITKWHERYEYRIEDIDLMNKQNLTIEEWNKLAFNYKNAYIAVYMKEHQMYKAYAVHDVTAQIDLLLSTQGAEAFHWSNVSQAITMVENTRSVRAGDFKANKARLFKDELFVDIPLFTSAD
ncbi:hypothetical protein [Marinicrinis lubricantis]|uniref:LXG domain-containing protein n=1 Tax=Marinicrinis lubricantis TaxID=2086470 RepID=A0ABW1ISM6_9BACL